MRERTTRSGLGLEVQREAIKLFAVAEQCKLVDVFVEDALERRPQLAAALAEARKRGGAVVSPSWIG